MGADTDSAALAGLMVLVYGSEGWGFESLERVSEPAACLVHLREPHPLSIMPASDGTASRRR